MKKDYTIKDIKPGLVFHNINRLVEFRALIIDNMQFKASVICDNRQNQYFKPGHIIKFRVENAVHNFNSGEWIMGSINIKQKHYEVYC